MRRTYLSLLSTLFCASIISSSVFAAAYQLYEVGTPIIGTAGVGQAAVAMDASTAYFNPAGMALLPASGFMVGSELLLPYTNFSANRSNTISGDNGGNAGILTPGMSSYLVFSYSPCLKFGLAVVSPYGGTLMYSDGWAGRYNVQNAMFAAVNVNPSFAFKFNGLLWAPGSQLSICS